MEQDNRTETIKKSLILLIILAVAGVYYFQSHKKPSSKVVKNKPKIEVKKEPVKSTNLEVKKNLKIRPKIDNSKKITTKQIIPPKKQIKKVEKKTLATSNKIKPTNITQLIKVANKNSGKNDPFVHAGTGEVNANFNINNLSSIQGLPTTEAFKSLQEHNSIELKGFLNNKALISVNGQTEALTINDTYRGVKIVSIDAKNMRVKLDKNGKIIIKTIKSLASTQGRKDITINKITNN